MKKLFTLNTKLISIVLILSLGLSVFAGCSASQSTNDTPSTESTGSTSQDTTQNETSQTNESETEEIPQEDGFPVTITDHLDREVTIEEKPQKLVSGYYVSTSMLISLGLKDNVVGIEAKAETRPIYQLAAPEFLELPNVGTAKEFNLEGCIALEPDLVILPVSLREQTVGLEEIGINVIYVNPESQILLEEAYIAIGTATGTKERAEEIIAYAYDSLDALNTKLADEDKQTVYLGGNSDFLSTAGAKMYQNTMIENANCINVAADIEDTYWANVSNEQILAYNADNIILAAAAQYTVDDVINNANISAVSAVQNSKVYAMPSNIEAWDSPVPSAFLGSLWIASNVYPELYSLEEFESTVSDFYSKYYGFEAP